MIDKNKVLNILQGEIDKHSEYFENLPTADNLAKHGWRMFINGMVEAKDIIAEMESE